MRPKIIKALQDCALYGKDLTKTKTPVDIIGMGEMGKILAEELAKIVGKKEVCYYDKEKRNPNYHFMEFQDMLAETKFIFITEPGYEALFNNLDGLNQAAKIISLL